MPILALGLDTPQAARHAAEGAAFGAESTLPSRCQQPIRGKLLAAPARARYKYSGINVPWPRGFSRAIPMKVHVKVSITIDAAQCLKALALVLLVLL